jgi:hypothetical protein
MIIRGKSHKLASEWRVTADTDNPAGALFASGGFAQADIVCETGTTSGKCGTACSGSTPYQCC